MLVFPLISGGDVVDELEDFAVVGAFGEVEGPVEEGFLAEVGEEDVEAVGVEGYGIVGHGSGDGGRSGTGFGESLFVFVGRVSAVKRGSDVAADGVCCLAPCV